MLTTPGFLKGLGLGTREVRAVESRIEITADDGRVRMWLDLSEGVTDFEDLLLDGVPIITDAEGWGEGALVDRVKEWSPEDVAEAALLLAEFGEVAVAAGEVVNSVAQLKDMVGDEYIGWYASARDAGWALAAKFMTAEQWATIETFKAYFDFAKYALDMDTDGAIYMVEGRCGGRRGFYVFNA